MNEADSAVAGEVLEPRLPPAEFDAARPTAPPRARRAVLALLGILLLGGAVRAWMIADLRLGYEDDQVLFIAWARELASKGLAEFYATRGFCDYPPLGVLLFKAVGHVAELWPAEAQTDALFKVLLKIPACLLDLVIALVLFLAARRLLGAWAGTAAAALYFLNPVVIYDSAYWGQVDSIYTLFVLLAVVWTGRRTWSAAGAATAAGMLAKFQTVAFVPLILFEVYRIGRWRAVFAFILTFVVLAALVLAPFAWTGTVDDVLQRSYVHVIGQYHDLSKGAYNLWHVIGPPNAPDTSIPNLVARLVAQGRTEFPADASWMLWLTWRHISVVGYALVVALVLTLYSLRPGPIARYGAAGLLGLAFYLFPTEMHERYAFPALALLAPWAVSSRWRERAFFLLTALLLLNLAGVLSPAPLSPQIGAANVVLFGGILVALLWPAGARPGEPAATTLPLPLEVEVARPPVLVPLFRWATLGACVAAIGLAGWIVAAGLRAPPVTAPAGVSYLSDLTPRTARQGWRKLQRDRSVGGGVIQLGEKVYLRGLGTHATSRLVYDVPPEAELFEALVGIDASTRGNGSVTVAVELDGRSVFSSPVLTGDSDPIALRIPLQGARRLTLLADATSDGQRSDHVDWAAARLVRGNGSAPSSAPTTRPVRPLTTRPTSAPATDSAPAENLLESALERLRQLRP